MRLLPLNKKMNQLRKKNDELEGEVKAMKSTSEEQSNLKKSEIDALNLQIKELKKEERNERSQFIGVNQKCRIRNGKN